MTIQPDPPTIADLAHAVLMGSARPGDLRALAARVLEEHAQWRQREHLVRGLEGQVARLQSELDAALSLVTTLEGVVRDA